MDYAQLNVDGTFYRQITTSENVEWDATHLCPASVLTPAEASLFRVVPFVPVSQPVYDILTQRAVYDGGELVGDQWQTKWVIESLPIEEATARAELAENQRVASLWKAAHDYEYAQISGSALSLLVLGVLQNLPKSLAIKAWSKSIWTEYYTRKASGSTNYDFTLIGNMPHSVPELMVELGE